MEWRDRQGNLVPGEKGQDKILNFLYATAVGRGIVYVLIRPWVSRLAGAMMDCRLSCIAIKSFRKKCGIDMSQFEDRKYKSFNDFFGRQVREGARPIDADPTHLIAPCDSKVTAYSISDDLRVTIKGTEYTMDTLFRDSAIAETFAGGSFLLFRLTKDDYHRYCYIDSGIKGENVHIPGVFHTVNPAALSRRQVYKENTREYTLLESQQFGRIVMMEIGATMVGRIRNYHGAQEVQRGQEKGRFEFGGSSIVVCLQKGAVDLDRDILMNTASDIETVVHMGERIGIRPIEE
jgi:phosphatidylserine decarboxylase